VLNGTAADSVWVASDCVVRRAPVPDSELLGLAEEGTVYARLGTSDGWCKIAFNGIPGWIRSDATFMAVDLSDGASVRDVTTTIAEEQSLVVPGRLIDLDKFNAFVAAIDTTDALWIASGFLLLILAFILTRTKQRIRRRRRVDIKRRVSSALEGDISGDTVQELLQLMELGHKTGCLLLTDKRPFALVYFEHGIITHAISHKAHDMQAVFRALALRQGHFRLASDRRPERRTCHLRSSAVLLEWARRHDEKQRRHTRPVGPVGLVISSDTRSFMAIGQ
jgi:hypothetical protein